MIKVGDSVKVIGTSMCGGRECELIPIGTVCIVQEVDELIDGTCVLIRDPYKNDFWYLEKDVEKGHVVTRWVKESESTKTWLISGPDLSTLEIVADSFDAALAEARIVDVRYNTGQVKEE